MIVKVVKKFLLAPNYGKRMGHFLLTRNYKKIVSDFLIAPGYGIDLGTANTVIYMTNHGIILNEPSVIAVKNINNKIIPYAVGNEAKQMLGKTPTNIIASRPLKDGVISDFKCAQSMIRMFVEKVVKKRPIIGPLIVICVPYGSTQVERRAIQESANSVGPRKVLLVEEPMAAAIGANLPVTKPIGSMIVDIGGGTTEVAIIALGGVVYAKSTKVGGDAMDEAIMNYIKKEHNLLIGESTAEIIKKTIGSAIKEGSCDENQKIKITGRSSINGSPCEIEILKDQITDSLKETVDKIISSIKFALEQAPPELSRDIAEFGITLSGGGSLLRRMTEAISKETNLKVKIARDPLSCVANGIGKIILNIKELDNILFEQA